MEASSFTQAQPTDDRPWHGTKCPVCRNGLLYAIAETEDGALLRCFNCDTQGSVNRTDAYLASVPAGENVATTPTGFTVSHEQARIQAAGGDPEAAAAAERQQGRPLAAGERADYDARLAELQRQLDEARGQGGQGA